MSNLLDLKSIYQNYGAVQALSGVDLSVDDGDVLAGQQRQLTPP